MLPRPGRAAGVVLAGELAAAGLSAARIRSLVRQGVLAPAGRGIYAHAAPAAALAAQPGGEHALRIAAALAVTGPEAAGSHHSAALVHRLDLLGRTHLPGTVTVTRRAGAPGSRTARPGIRLHIAALPPGHVTTRHGGLRVTSAARTVVDLARMSSFRAGVVTADSALHSGQTSLGDLRGVLAECARWKGIGQARQVVEFADGRSESVLESLSRVVFRERGLPPPELQVWVGAGGMTLGRVDFLWRRYRTIGEADGAMKYSNPASARAQLQRDARLREAGFEVVHFTWQEITRVPHQVAASVRAAFQRAGR